MSTADLLIMLSLLCSFIGTFFINKWSVSRALFALGFVFAVVSIILQLKQY